ncbi:hypothetical protein L7F22_023711, partial [Adiantum nelumboides]|nr:hypothetical protein [Adiantum nelumboides]
MALQYMPSKDYYWRDNMRGSLQFPNFGLTWRNGGGFMAEFFLLSVWFFQVYGRFHAGFGFVLVLHGKGLLASSCQVFLTYVTDLPSMAIVYGCKWFMESALHIMDPFINVVIVDVMDLQDVLSVICMEWTGLMYSRSKWGAFSVAISLMLLRNVLNSRNVFDKAFSNHVSPFKAWDVAIEDT